MGQMMGLTRGGAKKRVARALSRTRAQLDEREWLPGVLAPLWFLLRRARAAAKPLLNLRRQPMLRLASFSGIVALAAIVAGENPPAGRSVDRSRDAASLGNEYSWSLQIEPTEWLNPSVVNPKSAKKAARTGWRANKIAATTEAKDFWTTNYQNSWFTVTQFKHPLASGHAEEAAAQLIKMSAAACANDSDMTPKPATLAVATTSATEKTISTPPANLLACWYVNSWQVSPGKQIDLEIHNGPSTSASATNSAFAALSPAFLDSGQSPSLAQILAAQGAAPVVPSSASVVSDESTAKIVAVGALQGLLQLAPTENQIAPLKNGMPVVKPASHTLDDATGAVILADDLTAPSDYLPLSQYSSNIAYAAGSVEIHSTFDVNPTTVPEPASMSLLVLSAGCFLRRRRN